MPTTLADRRKKIKQANARLQVDETWAGIKERKARTRLLIELGARLEKHAIASLDEASLVGALEEFDLAAKDSKTLHRWRKSGQEKLDREAAAKAQPPQVITITFQDTVDVALAGRLRAAGFRLNKLFGRWEGLARPSEAQVLASAHGGAIEVVSPLPPREPLPVAAE